MSTRATYSFENLEGLVTTIYKHHDGYPEGAAHHLFESHTAEKFLRKNVDSEITKSHEYHGDTEYRYKICRRREGTRLTVYKREWECGWKPYFHGDLDTFIGKYLKD